MKELELVDTEKMRRDDLRAEYNAVVSYHTALVVGRFTIAGLLTGGSVFLAAAALSADRSPALKAFCGAFAAWLTLCVWILELRSRALYRSIARRGMQIEHGQWGLTGKHWYAGFFSRQYNDEPPADYAGDATPSKPEQDVTTVFGRPLPTKLTKWVTHSMGFDFLYACAVIFWSLTAIYYGYRTVCPSALCAP